MAVVAARRRMLSAGSGLLLAPVLAGLLIFLWNGRHLSGTKVGIPLLSLPFEVNTVRVKSPQTDILQIVRQADGRVLALSGRDLAWNHCPILWSDASGLFREPCRGSMFDRQGRLVGGPGPFGMGQFPARVDGDLFVVDLGAPPVPVSVRP